MEPLRHDEEREPTPPCLPSLSDMSDEELSDLDVIESHAVPGYLTLELDVSELQARVLGADTAAHAAGRGGQEPGIETLDWPDSVPEDLKLEAAELLEPEAAEFSGYLTIETDGEAPGDGHLADH